MRKHLYNYLYLTRQERNGLLVLMILSIIVALAPHLYSIFKPTETTNFASFIQDIEIFQKAEGAPKHFAFANQKTKRENSSQSFELFDFDPNSTSKEDFIRLGLSSKTTQTIINFRNKGAKFFKKEDLKKVYGLKSSDYERLKDFIQIEQQPLAFTTIPKNEIPKTYEDVTPIKPTPFDPNTADEKLLLQNGIPQYTVKTILKFREKGGTFKTKEDLKKIYNLKPEIYQKIEPYIEIASTPKREIVKASAKKEDFTKEKNQSKNIVIDINKASPEEWQQLQGIGPSFSKRIVKFRDKLGGFSSINQVGETYGLPDSTFQKIKAQLQPSPIFKRIHLNHATEKQLKAHPYISWNQAKLIVSYRNMHGDFKDVNELLEIKVLKKEWVEKIKIYLMI